MGIKAEFERMRHLLGAAIDKAYQGLYMVPPIEIAPGYWKLWPHRAVRVKLDEARFWQWGAPGGHTGNLQVKIYVPYNSVRFPVKKSTAESVAKRVAETAKQYSAAISAMHNDASPEAQQAYVAGYKTVEEATEEARRNLWIFRGPTWTEHRANWGNLHTAIHTFLKLPEPMGILDWIPDDASEPKWDPLLKTFDQNTLYDKAMQGVLDAIDDWAIERGLITEKDYVRE